MVSIKGKSKAAVLAALYNRSRHQGMGILDPASRLDMSESTARGMLEAGQTYFDYINGRVIKVGLASDDEFDERLYDRDLGAGAAQRAVNSLAC